MGWKLRRWRPRPAGKGGFAGTAWVGLIVTICGFVSLAVDYGRVQVAKMELHQSCDACARAAAAALPSGVSTATSTAQTYATYNIVDGAAGTLNSSTDIQFGLWNAATGSFTILTGSAQSSANAVQVTLWRRASSNNAIPLVFGQILGFNSSQAHATATAYYVAGSSVTNSPVQAIGNPYLAGMSSGSEASWSNPANSPDYAPTNSPNQVSVSLTNATAITVTSVTGSTLNYGGTPSNGPTGVSSNVGDNYGGAENGISDANVPIGALVGVFLTNSQPSLSTAPASLDFSTSTEQNYTTISPQIQQVFYIGSGQTSSGQQQQIMVPSGATRLFVASWDFYQYNNNVGSFQINANAQPIISLVQ
jgi:hypothetical protein